MRLYVKLRKPKDNVQLCLVHCETKLNQLSIFCFLTIQMGKKKKRLSSNTASLHSTMKERSYCSLLRKGINALSAMTGEQDCLCLV